MRNIDFCIFAISFHLGHHLNISKRSMMPKWHHLDSSRARSAKQDSVKKKTLELNSRSSLSSAFFYRTKLSVVVISFSINMLK